VSATRGRIAGWGLALLFLANAGVVVALWLGGGGLQDIRDSASFLVGLGRISGLVGAYLVLVELLLLARLPLLERLLGFERLTRWHAWNGRVCLTLLVSHAVLVTWGYTIGDRISLPSEIGRLWNGYPGVITATAGLVILIGVVVTSVVAVRRRLERRVRVDRPRRLGVVAGQQDDRDGRDEQRDNHLRHQNANRSVTMCRRDTPVRARLAWVASVIAGEPQT